MMQNSKFHLTVYTIMHFVVDLACIFYMAGMVDVRLPDAQRVYAAVIYNMLAFALPMLLGFLADLAGRNALVSCIGCLLLLVNYLMVPMPWVSVALLGIGNGLFHIGGGRQVLQDSMERTGKNRRNGIRFAPSGIFIASGALGVYLGRKMAVAFRQIFMISIWIVLAVCVALLVFCAVRQRAFDVRSRLKAQKTGGKMVLFSLLLFLVVIVRSYYGFLTVYSWNNTFMTGLIFTLCIVAGKFTGGILADWLGVTASSVISLAGAGILALFAAQSPVLGCLSILLFNMTMPITLTLLTQLWKELPGFAFGTLMMALFLGTLPTMLWHVRRFSSPWGQFGLCMVSLVMLLAVLHGTGAFSDMVRNRK